MRSDNLSILSEAPDGNFGGNEKLHRARLRICGVCGSVNSLEGVDVCHEPFTMSVVSRGSSVAPRSDDRNRQTSFLRETDKISQLASTGGTAVTKSQCS